MILLRYTFHANIFTLEAAAAFVKTFHESEEPGSQLIWCVTRAVHNEFTHNGSGHRVVLGPLEDVDGVLGVVSKLVKIVQDNLIT